MNAARFGGFPNGDFVAEALRYRQRDLVAQNAKWNLEETTPVLLSVPVRWVK